MTDPLTSSLSQADEERLMSALSSRDSAPHPAFKYADPVQVVTVTPEIFAALAKAQEQAKTVAKGGYNRHAGYNYATAEDMIAAGRAARKGTGLALLTSWTVEARDGAAPVLTLTWLLTHASGGMLRGSLVAPIQSSKRNGADKQTAALATYLEGFVERSLMRLDREGTPPAEDRDAQDDRAEPPPPGQPPYTEDRAVARIRGYLLNLHSEGKADEPTVARAVEAAGKLGVSEATVRGWLPTPPEERESAEEQAIARAMGIDLAPIEALEIAASPEALIGVCRRHAEALRDLPSAIVGAALAKHAERLEVDVAKLDAAIGGVL